MTSEKQIAANRANAAQSTGPTTPEGKAAVRLNAIKHGLLSREVLLPGEEAQQLVRLGKRLRSELAPIGELETLLADRVISSAWRLRRLLRVEIGIFERFRYNYQDEDQGAGFAFSRDADSTDSFSRLARYEATIERGMFRALSHLRRLQAERKRTEVPPEGAVDAEFRAD